MNYIPLSFEESKKIIDTMPKILIFNSESHIEHLDNDNSFHMFEQLPEDLQIKIATTSNSPEFFRTKKLYSNIGKQDYYDLVCTNTAPSLKELNKYIKSLQKNTPTRMGLFAIFVNNRTKIYYSHYDLINIELKEKNKLVVTNNMGGLIRVLMNANSLIDYFLTRAGVSGEEELVTIFF